jgi:site-specific DNA-methyltransferase (adenine-specific)
VRNTLFYGDNLDILRKRVPDASVDLVYLDPPFKLLAGDGFDFPSQSVLKGSKQGPSAKVDAGQGSLEM